VLVGKNGQRFIAYDDDGTVGLPIDLDLDLIRSARVLILDVYGLAAGVRAAAAAHEAGVAVVADIERATDAGVGDLFDLSDHLVLPEQVALAWTGADTPAQAVDALWRADRSAVVVTGGGEGCWYRAAADGRDSAVRHHAAPKVAVVDTTGCGDVFHGVYAAFLTRGAPVSRCITEATLAAAECATHPGGIAPRLTSPHLVLGR
jgi:sulfofructose kinase